MPIPVPALDDRSYPDLVEELQARLPDAEKQRLAGVLDGLQRVYHVTRAEPYVTTPVFPGSQADPAGFDMIEGTVDKSLWLGLFVKDEKLLDAVRETLSRGASGGA